MVTLFHDMMHKEIDVYVDNIIAKSKEGEDHLVNLKQLFDRLKKYKFRLNLAKCTFGVKSRKLLGQGISDSAASVGPTFTGSSSHSVPDSTPTVHRMQVMQRLRQYTLYHTVCLLSKMDPLKYLLGSPSSMRNIAKWCCQLMEYDIEYVSRTSVKGQAIADHLAEFPIDDDTPIDSDFPDEGILQNQFADALATLASMVSITKENLIEPLEFEIAKGPAHCDMIEAIDGYPWRTL
ncbi:hypothetical protein CRG98_019578 [Punica granatum]|uniref:Reverse transcriptase domain-containing protein n=1 Tax=Punica granatum TaxID=22663 RepID=A0A2I0JUP3_PUNGR|nr:hypothetical protein CRG98_019578 [Punica granatum]